MANELVVIKQHLAKGGAFCKAFNRFRFDEERHWQIELAYAMEIIERAAADGNPQLASCTPESIGRSLVDLGAMGLSLSPVKREAYLIPYKDQCTVSPSYMGLEQVAYRTGLVNMIQANIVCKNDEFVVWTDDAGRHIKHGEAQGERGPVTHAYCMAMFATGERHIEVMTTEEILACRDAATKKNKGKTPFTWQGAFQHEMYKKCPVRRAQKHWPKSSNAKVLAMLDVLHRTDPLEFSNKDQVIEVSDKLSPDQITNLIEQMQTAGVPKEGHDSWLQALAKRMGYPRIREVKAEDFDEASSLMAQGIERWQARSSTSQSPPKSSGSVQANTTSPAAVT